MGYKKIFNVALGLTLMVTGVWSFLRVRERPAPGRRCRQCGRSSVI